MSAAQAKIDVGVDGYNTLEAKAGLDEYLPFSTMCGWWQSAAVPQILRTRRVGSSYLTAARFPISLPLARPLAA